MAFQITQDQAQDVKVMLKEFFFWMRENNLEKVTLERSDKELKIEFDKGDHIERGLPHTEDEFFVIKLKDRHAQSALLGYLQSIVSDATYDADYAMDIKELAKRLGQAALGSCPD